MAAAASDRMKTKIAAVVSFLKRLVKLKDKVEKEKMEVFAERLAVALQKKFEGHWFTEKPNKGQVYRCIRVNTLHKHDPELLQACRESGVHYDDLGLPWVITLWVDPGEVHGRYREQNFHFSVDIYSTDSGLSDEKTTHSSRLTVPNRKCSHKKLNPAAPAWHPNKKPSGMGHSKARLLAPRQNRPTLGKSPLTILNNI